MKKIDKQRAASDTAAVNAKFGGDSAPIKKVDATAGALDKPTPELKQSFSQTFRAARNDPEAMKRGTFTWNGKSFSTKMASEMGSKPAAKPAPKPQAQNTTPAKPTPKPAASTLSASSSSDEDRKSTRLNSSH